MSWCSVKPNPNKQTKRKKEKKDTRVRFILIGLISSAETFKENDIQNTCLSFSMKHISNEMAELPDYTLLVFTGIPLIKMYIAVQVLVVTMHLFLTEFSSEW
jgi:hypothetical protein